MSDEAIPHTVPLASEEPLAIDTPCIHCGYNVRGLLPSGLCPECGRPVVDSTRGNLLRYADPVWLERLRKGAALKLWNILIMLVLGIGAGVLLSVTGSPLVQIVVGLIGGALGLWAIFLITCQEPRVALNEDPMALRRVVRACAVANFIGAFLPQIGAFGVFAGTGDIVSLVLAGVFVLLSLAGVVVLFGELVYLRRFAWRIPEEKLAKSTSIVLWLLPVGTLLMAIGSVLVVFVGVSVGGIGPPTPGAAPLSPSTAMIVLMGLTGGLGFLLMIVGGVLYISLLIKYRKAFAEAAALSRAGQ